MFNFIVGVITIIVFYKIGKFIYNEFYNIDIFRKKKKKRDQE